MICVGSTAIYEKVGDDRSRKRGREGVRVVKITKEAFVVKATG
jgi:hypothetical protein